MLEHEFSGDASIISVQRGWEGNALTGDALVFLEGYDQLTDLFSRRCRCSFKHRWY
ncbi:MAG: hypothetical protein ACI9UT_001584 [Flavobacteriales bacterium]|jgi:hypothetical protein